MNLKTAHHCLVSGALVCAACWPLVSAQAQTRVVCDSSITDADGYKIRRVVVDARYAALPLPPKGTPFTRAVERQLLNDVRAAFRRERNRENEPGATLYQLTGLAPTLFELNALTTCARPVAESDCREALAQDKCLDLTVEAKSLRFSPDAIGQNLLGALPRSNRATLLGQAPKALLILNPQIGATADRAFGLAVTIAINTDLLSLRPTLRGEPLPLRNNRLDLRAQGRKSLNQPFYDTALALSYTHKLPASLVPAVGAEVGFIAQHQPLGEADYLRNAITLNAQVRLAAPVPIIKRLDLNAGFRRASHRLSRPGGASERTSEQAGYASALLSGQLALDFWRAGLWYERGSPASAPGSYQRAAGLAGYAKEFGRGNQTVSLEVLLGAGRAWGSLPRYAQFFGGNTAQNFLYDSEAASYLNAFPPGPVLRSFGHAQLSARRDAAVAGASSYAHVNLSLALPIPAWSRPLIPNEEVEIEDPVTGEIQRRSLRQIIRNQAKSGETILRAIYQKQGMPNAEAQARREFRAINHALGFLTDRANLYAVKPLILFEAARLNLTGAPTDRTRIGLGAGLQFTVTIARFEAGYVFATRRAPGEQRGNFTLRLFFQNLF
jgi:hypothetical protein